jgi:hypothetical protein
MIKYECDICGGSVSLIPGIGGRVSEYHCSECGEWFPPCMGCGDPAIH